MDLSALQQQLRDFASERRWQEFHTPKNLAMALMVESAELLELFQWMTPEQSQSVRVDPVQKAKAADEVADVLLYLLQLADQLGIDIPQAVGQKLLKNAQKHPAPVQPANVVTSRDVNVMQTSSVGVIPASEVSAKAENVDSVHVLIDWENVQPAWNEVQAMVPDCTHVWLLHGPHQKQMDAGYQSLGDRFTSVPSVQAGKNSLDFQLSFYCGYLASKKGRRLVVVANDLGYEPMINHARLLGFDAVRLGVSAARPVALKKPADAPARGAVVQGAPALSCDAGTDKAQVLADLPPSLPSPSAAQYASRLLTIWRENQNRPAKPAALLNAIKAMTRSENIDAPMVQKVYSLLQTRGEIRVDGAGGQLIYK